MNELRESPGMKHRSTWRLRVLLFSVFIFLTIFTNNMEGISWYRCTSQNLGSDVFSFMTSSSQFISSTDGCAWLESDLQKKRDAFFDANFEDIKNDAARGNGDTLSTFLAMYSCSLTDIQIANNKIKESYELLFLVDSNSSKLGPKTVDPIRARAERGIYKIITKEMIGSSCHK